ncbi:unnamed protein product [Nippostrongylus brasiliensis]|uniref:Annexin n=1 Tax=Nippostrongylus brasiliensis TaxID=27835 RepID=A0A0N4YKU4_NIPBR|nr:unnamed protein product [Nippostrongylus brasiliensis]
MLQSASGDPQGTLKMAIGPYPPPMISPPLSCHSCVVGTTKAKRRAHPNGELSVSALLTTVTTFHGVAAKAKTLYLHNLEPIGAEPGFRFRITGHESYSAYPQPYPAYGAPAYVQQPPVYVQPPVHAPPQIVELYPPGQSSILVPCALAAISINKRSLIGRLVSVFFAFVAPVKEMLSQPAQGSSLRVRLLTKGYRQNLVDVALARVPRERLQYVECYIKAMSILEMKGVEAEKTVKFLVDSNISNKQVFLGLLTTQGDRVKALDMLLGTR